MKDKKQLSTEDQNKNLDRRSFLKASSAAVVGAAIATPILGTVPAKKAEDVKASTETTKASSKDGHRRAGWLAI